MLQHIFPATFKCKSRAGLAPSKFLVYFRLFPSVPVEGCPRTVQPWLELEKEDGHGGGRAGLLLPVGTTITSIV